MQYEGTFRAKLRLQPLVLLCGASSLGGLEAPTMMACSQAANIDQENRSVFLIGHTYALCNKTSSHTCELVKVGS
jgi:hypothetical protein